MNTHRAIIENADSDYVTVSGELSFGTVRDLLDRHASVGSGFAHGTGHGSGEASGSGEADAAVITIVVDVSGVTQIDSAGLSLLMHWDGAARQGGRRLAFRGASPELVSLARVAGLGERFD